MNESYAKLFGSITTSTIWSEPHATRVVWVTMMAIADRNGEVDGSVPGLARIANVTLPECEAALATFLAPDPYSRTPDFEGRRIEAIRGGWRLLNHGYYRRKLDAEDRRERKAKWMRESRAKQPKPPATPDGHGEQPEPTKPECGQESPHASTQATSGQSGHITDAPADTATDALRARAAREPIPAAVACIAMREAGCTRTNPSDPDLLAALAEGVEPQTLADCAREAIEAGKKTPFRYAIAVSRSRNAEGPAPVGVRSANSLSSSHGRRRLSVVEQVERDIADRREREAAGGNVIDGTCERVAAG